MSSRGSKKLKQSQRQKMTQRMVIAAGIAASTVTLVLVIYFQFFRNDITKAEKPLILTQDQLPVELNIEEIVITPADSNQRNGVRFKIAKPLPVENK